MSPKRTRGTASQSRERDLTKDERERVLLVPHTAAVEGQERQAHVLTIPLGGDEHSYVGSLPSPEIETKFWLTETERNGHPQKELMITVLCDGAPGEIIQPIPESRFRDAEHTDKWVQSAIDYLYFHLPQRLRKILLLTAIEAIAKSSQLHGISDFDEKGLAEDHALIVERQIKKALGVRPGPEGLFKHAHQYKLALVEAAKKLRGKNAPVTQEGCAGEIAEAYAEELVSADVDSRQIRKWNNDFKVNWKKFAAIQNRKN